VCFEPPHGSRRRLKAVEGVHKGTQPTRTISGKTTISKRLRYEAFRECEKHDDVIVIGPTSEGKLSSLVSFL